MIDGILTYHRTKLAESAMIITAVYDSLIHNRIKKEYMCDIGNDELLEKLRKDGTDVSKRIVENFEKRNLYYSLFEIKSEEISLTQNHSAEKLDPLKHYSDPYNR